jgi:hypothetical protein
MYTMNEFTVHVIKNIRENDFLIFNLFSLYNKSNVDVA